MTSPPRFRQHSSHWGAFGARTGADGRLEVRPFAGDPEPSVLLANLSSALRHPARLGRPLVRSGWLKDGPGPDPRRGRDTYVEMDWDAALNLAARELKRLGAAPDLPRTGPLPGAHVFGGSYGWASAGRFHHAQSQLHRFLNAGFGGYVASVDTYSTAAGSVILSMVWGDAMRLNRDHPYLDELGSHTDLLISFGGLPLRNTAISPGGNSQHSVRQVLDRAAARGCRFVSVSPIADDMETLPGLMHLAPRPGTDVALMLGMAHRLHATGRADRAYLDRYTTGYDRFLGYLTGAEDGVDDFIPCARIADLLLRPGETYSYKGQRRHYADIRLVYWAGGNPFHHHQDLARLTQAFARPETIIVHDSVGTATAGHADIVFPATLTAEREDIGAGGNDPFLVAMEPLAMPHGEARNDFDIFAALAERAGFGAAFTEGLDSTGWLRRIYAPTRKALAARGWPAPDYDDFRGGMVLPLPIRETGGDLRRFHSDPDSHPQATPSGRIEIFSDRVAAAGLPGHPAWLPPAEWLGAPLAESHPFQLVANQPAGRLHSQLDFGEASMKAKRNGREVARLNPSDADRLGIAEGDVIRLWNARGGVLASAQPCTAIRPGVIQLATGAWYAPVDLPGLGTTCVNGNPNAVTADIPTSPLSQGCAGQLSLVSVERLAGPAPAGVPHAEILPRAATP